MKYLGITPKKPRVAVFDFTGCEGCQLQLSNKEESLVAFLQAMEIVNFREISSSKTGAYDIALIDGAITRGDEVERLQTIRKQAKLVVALGSCASFGGINKQKNAVDLQKANEEVYGSQFKETLVARSARDVVRVDLAVPGCPVSKEEVERLVQHLVWDVPFRFPDYPVCLECKHRFKVCMFEKGKLCLGAITRGGCEAPCPSSGLGCWGCRGPATDVNYKEFFAIARQRGFSEEELQERLGFFGGFEGVSL
jgi:sulfhydrogenase subunit delta